MEDRSNPDRTELLIVGAGPFGLGMARYARAHGKDHRIVGRPMGFWRDNMPEGMLLRSGTDWHLDPLDELTILEFLDERGVDPEVAMPLSLDLYLDYAEWFRRRSAIEVDDVRVTRLGRTDGDAGRFVADLDDGGGIVADDVLLAIGFRDFVHEPDDLVARLPRERTSHTCDLVDLAPLRDHRCLIVGGRQSAYEWAALLAEAGAEAVHMSHRHPSPSLEEADWSWVGAMVDRMVQEPGWYRNLPAEERREVDRRFWEEGRLKLEPWLRDRLPEEVVRIWPETVVAAAEERADGSVRVQLEAAADDGDRPARSDGSRLVPGKGEAVAEFDVDRIILATGYEVDLDRVSFLDPELGRRIETTDGYPVLDEGFQCSVPGLYITSMAATRDFGPFLAFTVSVRSATKIVAAALDGGPASRDGSSGTAVGSSAPC